MLELNKRWIHFYSITVGTLPDDAPEFKLDECLKALKTEFARERLFKLINHKSACIRVSDMLLSTKNRRASLLFQYSDSKLSDPAFSELESGVLRSEPKLLGEGVAVSAHAIIFMDPIKEDGLEYLMLLEDVPGIGKSKIQPFLNSFLKSLMSREYINEEKNKLNSYPTLSLDHFASQTLAEDLEDGELKFIELIKRDVMRELDEDPYLESVFHTVKVKAVPKATGERAKDFVNRVKVIGKDKGYQDMKVVFKKEEGKQRSVKIPTFREDAGEALFGKMEMIDVDYDLVQCSPKIDRKFLAKMRSIT